MCALRGRDANRRVRRPKAVTPERWVAWRTIAATYDDGAYTDRALAKQLETFELDPRQRAQARHLAFGTVRHGARLDHVIATVGKRPLGKLEPPVVHALRLGLFQVLESTGIADHAAVDQSVEIVRAAVGERAVAFTNAILRRGLVDGPGILAKLDPSDTHDAAILASVPEWMVERMAAQHGADGIAALVAQLDPPATPPLRRNPLFQRTRSLDPATLPALDSPLAAALPDLRTIEPRAASVQPDRPELEQPDRAANAALLDRLLDRGAVMIQSAASQLVVRTLDLQLGDRVADLCAAPGGKTADIAARVAPVGGPAGRVLAVELHAHRTQDLVALVTRLGAADVVDTWTGDATTLGRPDGDGSAQRLDGPGSFDRALVDAPCTGLGVLAGRPDSRWRREPGDAAELAELQLELLAAACRLVRPGGVIAYSTCTMDRLECEEVVDAAIAQLPLEPRPIDPELLAALPADVPTAGRMGELRTWPHRHATDGFFCALLTRTDDDVVAAPPHRAAP